MSVKLLTEHQLEFLSLKGGCTGLSEYTCQNTTMLEMSHSSYIFLDIVTHPGHLPRKNLVGTTLKKMITVTKYIFLDIVTQAFSQEYVSKN